MTLPVPLLRRRFVAALVASTAAFAAFAQPQPARSPALVAPPWRPPVLVVTGAEQPVRLQSLKVETEVAGGVAETRVEMAFFNPNPRVLEGQLQFPLGHSQVVTGFALDVNGTLRDAVPVRKARAEQVFEDITRQRIDPGLLQHTQGNRYELRVYPLNPGQTRTVALRLSEPAAARFVLPLAYAASVPRVEVTLRYPAASERPEFDAGALGLAFAADRRGGYSAHAVRADAALPGSPLVVRSRPARGAEATTEARGADAWFSVSLPVADAHRLPRPLPRKLQIVWDQSASAAKRALDRELALLDAYFRRAGTIDVTLVRVADAVQPAERFAVRDSDWSALRKSLERTVYDGASRLGAVSHDGSSSEAIWFGDGMSNYGAPWQPGFPVPVFAVTSTASGDAPALAWLAESSGGRFIDLAAATDDAARRALLERGVEIVEASALGGRDLVVESRFPAAGRIAVAGAFTAQSAELTLRLRGPDGALSTRRLRVAQGQNPGRLAGTQWARLTLATLAGNTRANSQRAAEIGQRFAIATRETSLLVLERVEDYVRHQIEAPASEPALREAVAQLAARSRRGEEQSQAQRIARVVQRFEAKVAWWNSDFPKDDPKPLEIAAPGVGGALGGARDQAAQPRREADAMSRPMPAAPAAAPATKEGEATGRVARQAPMPSELRANAEVAKSVGAKSKADGPAGRDDIAIALKPAASDAAWLKRMAGADAATRLAVYLDERRGNAQSVGFFLEAADWFLARGDRDSRAVGLRALSNLAELDVQSRQLLRLLAYRLGQAGEHELAVRVFERVLELAPHEPQSHRDLALALAERNETGDRQRALGELYEVVSGRWDGRFADIDLIALGELNAIVARAERDGQALDTAGVDRRLLKNLPLDVRVVLAWDADATDVDLHVIDPNGEEVYYGRALSRQGGAISRDATGGYGPEEFALKVAKPGRYRVEANFFGHRQQMLTTSTGLMLWLSSGFGTAAQNDQKTTLRLKSQGGQRVVVGEFEVKGGRF